MGKLIPLFPSEVKKGKVIVHDKQGFALWLAKLEGQKTTLSLSKYKEQRTDPQNRYYWVVCTMVAEETGHTPEEIHETFKAMFLKRWIQIGKKRIQRILSTTELGTEGFNDYLDQCRHFASSELNLFIPLPGEIDMEEDFIS